MRSGPYSLLHLLPPLPCMPYYTPTITPSAGSPTACTVTDVRGSDQGSPAKRDSESQFDLNK